MLAAGCVLFAGHAGALELGELEVESFLGQPLRASIAYALGPHEQVAGYCIFVRGGGPAAGLPEVNAASVNVANGRIHLTSRGALREPMMNLRLSVDCAYTARIRRDYLLLLDPATNAGQQRPAADVAPATADAAPSPARRQAVAARTPRDASRAAAPLPSGSRYRV
ncbi:MAG TPA: hypothetical protein VFE85_03790, partial [Woeseiaceae bacterium]|nr:hypothetical protein [Woeseiaceae bacterium]